MTDTLIGLYPDLRSAEAVARALVAEGIPRQDVGIATSDARRSFTALTRPGAEGRPTASPGRATMVGALFGAVVGAVLSALVGMLPGLDWVLGAQASPSILGGAAVGALLGSAFGGLGTLGRRSAAPGAEASGREVMVLVDVPAGPLATQVERLLLAPEFVAVEHVGRPWRELGVPGVHPMTVAAAEDLMYGRQSRDAHPVAPAPDDPMLVAAHRAAWQLGSLIGAGDVPTWELALPIARARWETGPHAHVPFNAVQRQVHDGFEAGRAATV